MIRHFEKIENLGVFSKYTKPKDMIQFEKFNLIYGLNGSGKTTLSRFFHDLNTGAAAGFDDLKYKISTDDGLFTQGVPYIRKVRVFNSEYVEANIGELEGKLNPIFIIGEENKALVAVVEQDERLLKSLLALQSEKIAERDKLQKGRNKLFTEVAKKITTATAGVTTRNYKSNNAEAAFVSLSDAQILTIEQLSTAAATVKQQPMTKLAPLILGSATLKTSENSSIDYFATLNALEERILELVKKSAVSIALKRLTENPSIAHWVEAGIEIHKGSSDVTCEYCQQLIPPDRLRALGAHFNDSDSKLKLEIEQTIKELIVAQTHLLDLSLYASSALYTELQSAFSVASNDISSLKQLLVDHFAGLKQILDEKLSRRTESYVINFASYVGQPFLESLQSANDVISQHNSETDKFDERVRINNAKIEKHFLSELLDKVGDIDKATTDIEILLQLYKKGEPENDILGIDLLESRIRANRLKISNSHQAAEDLSKKLTSFLGRSDLRFEPEGEGYRIMRFDRAAKRLSEGEKTAITFLYFVVGLQAQDFQIADGIVVIDDPISSLDSSSVYQAFSFLKNSVKDARQIFLLTHNFEFLKLLLNWFQNIPGKRSDKTYWMLHCTSTNGTLRETELKALDKTLLKNKNEFTFLVKQLVEFESDGTIGQAYPIPNIVRKVLETFLEMHSNGDGFRGKLENLSFDKVKKDALYKYTNDLSHPTLSGLDPALVGETKTNVKHLLEMIGEVAPIHYKSLTDAISM